MGKFGQRLDKSLDQKLTKTFLPLGSFAALTPGAPPSSQTLDTDLLTCLPVCGRGIMRVPYTSERPQYRLTGGVFGGRLGCVSQF